MPEIKLTLPRPHMRQKEVLNAQSRFNILDCG